jgi:hypothetical protein
VRIEPVATKDEIRYNIAVKLTQISGVTVINQYPNGYNSPVYMLAAIDEFGQPWLYDRQKWTQLPAPIPEGINK